MLAWLSDRLGWLPHAGTNGWMGWWVGLGVACVYVFVVVL